MTTLSSPNRIVWDYFDALRRLVVESHKADAEAIRRQSAALAVVMSVSVVEVFFNIWFRVRAEEFHSTDEIMRLISELGHPRPWSLDQKLKHWPKRFLSKSINFDEGPGAEFMRIKKLRNSIIHFSSTHISTKHEGVVMHGLADTTEYDALSYEDARRALFAAEDLIGEIFLLAGVEPHNVRHMLHLWAGRVPL